MANKKRQRTKNVPNKKPKYTSKYRTSKIPYRIRHTEPLPDIDLNNIDQYDKEQLKQVILLNRDKYGKPTKRGRPTNYKPEYDYMAYVLLKTHGITIVQLADAFGVTESGIRGWMDAYPNFKKSIEKGRDEFDNEKVKKTLRARALGYEYEEKTVKYKRTPVKDKNGKVIRWEMRPVERTVYKKAMPPDVGAIAWWQKNRDSARWKDRKAVEISGPDGQPMEHNVHVYIPENGREKDK